MEKVKVWLGKLPAPVAWILGILLGIIDLFIIAIPVFLFPMPYWLKVVLALVYGTIFERLSGFFSFIIEFLVWIASIPFACMSEVNALLIVYFISAAGYLGFIFIPTIVSAIRLNKKIREENNSLE